MVDPEKIKVANKEMYEALAEYFKINAQMDKIMKEQIQPKLAELQESTGFNQLFQQRQVQKDKKLQLQAELKKYAEESEVV